MDKFYREIGRFVSWMIFPIGLLALAFWLGADFGQFACAKHQRCGGYTATSRSEEG